MEVAALLSRCQLGNQDCLWCTGSRYMRLSVLSVGGWGKDSALQASGLQPACVVPEAPVLYEVPHDFTCGQVSGQVVLVGGQDAVPTLLHKVQVRAKIGACWHVDDQVCVAVTPLVHGGEVDGAHAACSDGARQVGVNDLRDGCCQAACPIGSAVCALHRLQQVSCTGSSRCMSEHQ